MRAVVDAVVVPVEEIDEVVEAETPSRVLDLVVRAGRMPAFAFHREDADFARARVLERHRFAERSGRSVTGRPGVELEEESLAFHLRVAGETLVVAEERRSSQTSARSFAFGTRKRGSFVRS